MYIISNNRDDDNHCSRNKKASIAHFSWDESILLNDKPKKYIKTEENFISLTQKSNLLYDIKIGLTDN